MTTPRKRARKNRPTGFGRVLRPRVDSGFPSRPRYCWSLDYCTSTGQCRVKNDGSARVSDLGSPQPSQRARTSLSPGPCHERAECFVFGYQQEVPSQRSVLNELDSLNGKAVHWVQ